MRKRLLFLGIALAIVNSAYALPAPRDLAERNKKRVYAPRPTPTPTPAAVPLEPFITEPEAAATPSTQRRGGPPPVRRAEAVAPKKEREAAAKPTRSSTIVVVDAGHGGHDRGGIPRQRVSEKAMTLDVAQRLRNVLEQSGYRVVMTRNNDVFIPLGTRVAIANSYRDAIFVSVHFNSARRSGADGIETYFYSGQSLPLASAIHAQVVRGAPSPNRGIRRRGFFVLRRTRIPAVLVECGFLTNPNEARYVQASSYRQKLAEEIARGVQLRSSAGRSSYIDQTRVTRRRSARSKKRSAKSSKRRKTSALDLNSAQRIVAVNFRSTEG